jgi:hypothetical protein
MKIRNLFLVVSLSSIFAQPHQPAPQSLRTSSPAISTIKEVWRTYTTADGLANNMIYSIASDPAGNIWFATLGGVSKFDGTTWITRSNGPASDRVTAIARDSGGNLWFGSGHQVYELGAEGWGVSKFDGVSTTTYTTADGLAGNWVNAIASDSSGNLWFATFLGCDFKAGCFSAGVSKFDGSHWFTYSTLDGLASNWVSAIASDPAGNMWFGTDGGGVSKFDGAAWTIDTSANGLASNSVAAIASDLSGNMWVGTGGSGVSESYIIHLYCNYASGAPGSFFNLSGDHFPTNQSVPMTVNGTQLGDVPISSNGVFTFTLSTASASQGIYIVKVGERPTVQMRLWLDAQQPIRPKEGDYTVIDIPSGIALTPRFYLPTLRR